MRVETDPASPQSERRWWVRSAYEQSVMSRAGAYGRKELAPNMPIKRRDPSTAHPAYKSLGRDMVGTSAQAGSEGGFIIEELAHGELYIEGSELSIVESGLRAIATSKRVFRSVHPSEARLFIQVLDEQRAAHAVNQAMPAAGLALAQTVELTPDEISIRDMRESTQNEKV